MRRVADGSSITNLLVDGNNLVHRAFWSSEAKIKRGESARTDKFNQNIDIIYGVLSYVGQVLDEVQNVDKIHIFFDGYPKKRKEIFPDYKKREEGENVLDTSIDSNSHKFYFSSDIIEKNQIASLIRIFHILGFNVYHLPDQESDDLIASFVENSNDTNIILSSDKDFFQLVKNRTVVYRIGSDYPRIHDSERVEIAMEKLTKGVRIRPDQILTFKALTGDPSDGIKGVFRLRKSVAAKLSDFKNSEEIFSSDLSFLHKSEKENLFNSRETIDMNFKLVTMFKDLDVKSAKLSIDNNVNSLDFFKKSHNIPDYLFYPFSKREPVEFDPTPDFLLEI